MILASHRSRDAHASSSFFFFFNDTATTEIYTLSLHDALPISQLERPWIEIAKVPGTGETTLQRLARLDRDRKSTRLNSSHSQISYAVFCLKKKKTKGPHGSSPTCLLTLADHGDHDEGRMYTAT